MNDPLPSDSPPHHAERVTYAVNTHGGLELGDIYYTLFRHKWKILFTSVIGLAAAAWIFKSAPKVYRSDARLLIRYIQEEKNISAPDSGTGVKTPGGDSIVGAEIAILTSLDVAQKAADAIGYDKILGPGAGPESRYAAAGVILNGLETDVAGSSTVLEVSFKHENLALVQPVLAQVIEQYFQRHREVHTPSGAFDESLIQQTDQLKARLNQTEEELLRARKAAGIISLEDAKTTFGQQISLLRNTIFGLKAELAERQMTLKRYSEAIGAKLPDAEEKPSEPKVDLSNVPVAEYQSLIERYNALKRQKLELLSVFTEDSLRVKAVNERLAEFEKQKVALEKAHPILVQVAPKVANPVDLKERRGEYDPLMEGARIQALATRIQVLENQLEQVRAESAEVDKAEVNIQELQRRKSLEEANYRYLKSSLEQSRINDALGAGRVTNISQVQHPSPPIRIPGKSLKVALIFGVGGIALGIGWAFAIELLLDRTIKRPVDVLRHAGLNLFLSIPDMGGKRKKLGSTGPLPALPGGKASGSASGSGNEHAPWATDENGLQPYYDTLRDRVIGFFESENLTHKPKLIALAGVGPNSADSTVAAGLASSLSETEGGNVLFVDMTSGQGSTQQFFKGHAVGSIDDALVAKDKAQVQENLFVVSEIGKGDRLPRALPMRFSHLIPRLKASDFDFIIFNMPSVSSVSVTPRLAAFMDVVLLVIESEKADRDSVVRARDLLAESKTPIGAVLNKTHTYIPKALYRDPEEQL